VAVRWKQRLYLSREIASQVLSISVGDVDALVEQGKLVAEELNERTVIDTASVVELYGRSRNDRVEGSCVTLPPDLRRKARQAVQSLA
jgi:hypothetical protein